MYDSIAQLIKKMADEAREAAKPSNIITGTVISIEPISIQTDQKLILEKEFITVPEKLTDYEMEISFTDGEIIQGVCMRSGTETQKKCGYPECGGCNGYQGALNESENSWSRQEIRFSPPVKHKVIIHNALKKGDGVIMAVEAGGQKYYVMDRIVVK